MQKSKPKLKNAVKAPCSNLQIRYKIERSFGSIHKWFRGAVARYVGKAKMHSQHLLQAICYNLYRMPVIEVK